MDELAGEVLAPRPVGEVGVEPEIARHAAEGLTNPQIGERMFITRGTVKIHLSHIYTKLNLRNRSELAAQAARRAVEPGG
jgi:DNA-binding NarL/FixJ family response regulator